MQEHQIIIAKRFCGPPQSGNGGYVAGLLAKAIARPCQVTLHAPPPLDTPLRLLPVAEGLQLLDGDLLLATAKDYQLQMAAPQPPALASALSAERRYEGFQDHGLPNCFVCGPLRKASDGLRIFAGPLDAGADQVAAVWQPDATLDDGTGMVASEFVWAALDCPGFFAVKQASGTALLGRFAARLLEPVAIGESMIVSAWALGHDGRKHQAGTALYRQDGTPVALAEATWISLNKA
ncbi:hotdog fold domain-containing protein [Halopseudomonas laoshanensis]|uniref:hotdog fold domain-containing protein n=1 Tax=Halopseudomonas laoshanensis TaxID=2268758 RepID=UPI0037360377